MDGATPLDPDEAADLIPTHIRSQQELNEWEQLNIYEAASWAESTSMPVVNDSFVRELHKRMFNRTWRWAGSYRKSNKNIGVDWPSVSVHVRELMETGVWWIGNRTWTLEETALRLHHLLVQVHPFPNGNGRHARLWCDMLLRQHDRLPFEWKNHDLDCASDARTAYIQALRAADAHDYEPLLKLILPNRP